jgi:uncharacterized protein YutE (UPF0331/DUF86 family)/predicted nucleotidyltransferase
MKAKQISSKIKTEKIKLLKDYFKKEPQVSLAFLFGSQAKGISRKISDWDIAVYFKPREYLELETEIDYPKENKIWSDLINLLETDDVDLVVLNRAKPDLVFSVLNSGMSLVIKDRKLYLDLLCKTHYEAVDWWQFVFDFWKIKEKAKSLSIEAKKNIIERLDFLVEHFKDIEEFKKMTWDDYQDSRDNQRNIERWIENLVMASLDIAKIVMGSEKMAIPESYKDTLKVFSCITLKFSEKEADKFSDFAKIRNIIAHQYLDIKWRKIKNFIPAAEKIYPKFIKKVGQMVKQN